MFTAITPVLRIKHAVTKKSILFFYKPEPLVTNQQYYFSICCIVKDENDYIAEWIDFHQKVGVEHFYIYDNDSKKPVRIIEDCFSPVSVDTIQLNHYYCRSYEEYHQKVARGNGDTKRARKLEAFHIHNKESNAVEDTEILKVRDREAELA